MPSEQLIQPVDIDTIELRMYNRDTSDATVEELYRFGQILFQECLQRGSEVDRKLANLLGWSTAALAFLLLNHSKVENFAIPAKVFVTIATISALACVVLASIALKSRIWPSPSEGDWFRDGLWGDDQKLKRYHVVSLLINHQEHVKRIARKAECLKWAELLLPISAVAIGVAILLFS